MICPHCGYERNAENALYCNLCQVSFCKKKIPLQETQETQKTSTKKITTIDDLPDELKTKLLKEKDAIIHSKEDNFMDSKKMMLLGILLVLILLIIGGMFVLLPTIKTILTKGQG